jgi:hypothetical protein
MQRVAIPDELAARVMFDADRTCCVCRAEKARVQIHHIDEDTSNNSYDNLTVVCLHCHSDLHASGGFVRRLTPELVRLYNTSWREVVRARLGHPSDATDRAVLGAEALLEASLNCHHWKLQFMSIRGSMTSSGGPEFVDVWDAMAATWVPEYSAETYKKYSPLFNEGLKEIERRLDRVVQVFHDVLSPEFRTELARATRQLEGEGVVFRHLIGYGQSDTAAMLFKARFTGVITVLSGLARSADRRRTALLEAASLDV